MSWFHLKIFHRHVAEIEVDCVMYGDRTHLCNWSLWKPAPGGKGVMVSVFFYVLLVNCCWCGLPTWKWLSALPRLPKATSVHMKPCVTCVLYSTFPSSNTHHQQLSPMFASLLPIHHQATVYCPLHQKLTHDTLVCSRISTNTSKPFN